MNVASIASHNLSRSKNPNYYYYPAIVYVCVRAICKNFTPFLTDKNESYDNIKPE